MALVRGRGPGVSTDMVTLAAELLRRPCEDHDQDRVDPHITWAARLKTLADDHDREVAEAEVRGYHEGFYAALVEAIREVLLMDSVEHRGGAWLVTKAGVEAILRGMVSEHGLWDQARSEAETRGWDAAVEACQAALDQHHAACTEPCEICAEWDGLRREMTALRKGAT